MLLINDTFFISNKLIVPFSYPTKRWSFPLFSMTDTGEFFPFTPKPSISNPLLISYI